MADITITWPEEAALRVSGGFTGTPFLYICDSGNNRIQVTDYDGNPLFSFGSFGSGDGQFNSPYGVANDGVHVFVTDTGNNRVQYFDLFGNYLGQWGTYGNAVGEFSSPKGIATNGRFVFVVDQANNRFQVFNMVGDFMMAVGTFGSGDNQFDTPTNCYVDDFYLWIDDTGNHRVVFYELTFLGDYVLAEFPSLKSSLSTYIQSAVISAEFPSLKSDIASSMSIVSSIAAAFPGMGSEIGSLSVIRSSINVQVPALSANIKTSMVIGTVIDASLPGMQMEILSVQDITEAIAAEFPGLSSEIVSSIAADLLEFNTIVMNTMLKAVSTYTRWSFNSFAEFSGKQIGFSDEGIFELDGDEDGAGVKISATFITGQFDLQENGHKSKLYDTKFLGSMPGNYILTLRGDRNKLVAMNIAGFNNSLDVDTRRQKFSKNLKDRVFDLKFDNVLGAYFDLAEMLVNDEPVYREMKRG